MKLNGHPVKKPGELLSLCFSPLNITGHLHSPCKNQGQKNGHRAPLQTSKTQVNIAGPLPGDSFTL